MSKPTKLLDLYGPNGLLQKRVYEDTLAHDGTIRLVRNTHAVFEFNGQRRDAYIEAANNRDYTPNLPKIRAGLFGEQGYVVTAYESQTDKSATVVEFPLENEGGEAYVLRITAVPYLKDIWAFVDRGYLKDLADGNGAVTSAQVVTHIMDRTMNLEDFDFDPFGSTSLEELAEWYMGEACDAGVEFFPPSNHYADAEEKERFKDYRESKPYFELAKVEF